jgi:hypothetical protein
MKQSTGVPGQAEQPARHSEVREEASELLRAAGSEQALELGRISRTTGHSTANTFWSQRARRL